MRSLRSVFCRCLGLLAMISNTLFIVEENALAQSMKKTGENSEKPLLVGYFPQWGIYNDPQYLVKNLISSGGRPLVDQINYAQGFVTDGHCSVADPNADLN